MKNLNKFYKRWHEHCKSKAPSNKPHYKPGVASLKKVLNKIK